MKGSEFIHLEDMDAVVALGQMMQQECEPDIEFSELEVRSNLWMLLNDLERAQMNGWIVRHDDKIIGFGLGAISKFFFSTYKKASLLLWYVHPQYRKTRAAFEILHNFENWATLQLCARYEVGAAKCSVEEAEDINRMFTRRGFVRYGELFYRSL